MGYRYLYILAMAIHFFSNNREGILMGGDRLTRYAEKVAIKNGNVDKRCAPARGEIICIRCRNLSLPLAEQPFKGELGALILESTCRECWQAWREEGARIIRSLILDFTIEAHADEYDRRMKTFLRQTCSSMCRWRRRITRRS